MGRARGQPTLSPTKTGMATEMTTAKESQDEAGNGEGTGKGKSSDYGHLWERFRRLSGMGAIASRSLLLSTSPPLPATTTQHNTMHPDSYLILEVQ